MTTKIIKTDDSADLEDLPVFEWFIDQEGDLGYKIDEDTAVFFDGCVQHTEGGVNPGKGWKVHKVNVEIKVLR